MLYMSKETRESTVKYEVLSVASSGERPHKILITITQTSATFVSGITPHRLGTIEVEAKYISGPLDRSRILHQALVSTMGGNADTLNKSTKITTGVVEILVGSLRGLGIGTYMFAKVVQWAIDFDPTLDVKTIKAGPGDATEENRHRRNRFYKNFGVRFFDSEFDNETVEDFVAGRSMPMKVADLIPYEGWRSKVSISTVEKTLIQVEDDYGALRSTASDLTRCVNAKDRALERRDTSKRKLMKCYGFIIMALGLALAWKW